MKRQRQSVKKNYKENVFNKIENEKPSSPKKNKVGRPSKKDKKSYDDNDNRDKKREKKEKNINELIDIEIEIEKEKIGSPIVIYAEKKKKIIDPNNDKEIPLPKSIYDCSIVQTIKHFTNELSGQQVTFRKISGILHEFITNDNRILTLVFGGASGSGKTRSCEIIRDMFQLKEEQYIKIKMESIHDESQLSSLQGSGAGLVGYCSKETLPFKLLEAIGKPHKGAIDEDEDRSTQSYRDNQRRTNLCNKLERKGLPEKPPPKLIMIHFDELDKAHPNTLTKLLTFMEDGEFTSSSHVKFKLPKETKLLIIFTANYATDELATLKDSHYDRAVSFIYNDMKEAGIPEPTLGRITKSRIIPFFRLNEETMDKLTNTKIKKSLDHFNHRITELVHSNEDIDKDILKKYKKDISDSEGLGVRNADSWIQSFKEHLATNASVYISENIADALLPLKPNPSLSIEHYKPDQYDNLIELMKKTPDSFPFEVTEAIHDSIQGKTDYISLLFLNYIHDNVTHILTSLITSDNKNINITNINTNITNIEKQIIHPVINNNITNNNNVVIKRKKDGNINPIHKKKIMKWIEENEMGRYSSTSSLISDDTKIGSHSIAPIMRDLGYKRHTQYKHWFL